MLLGASSLINLDKTPSQQDQNEFNFGNNSNILIVHDSIKPTEKGNKYEIICLPSPNNPLNSEYYMVYQDRLFRLQGINPNENPVSVFVNDILSSPCSFLATFHFDVIFIFISILYLNKDKYLTMASRIIECYSSNPGNYSTHHLKSSVLFLWNNNFNNVKKRLEYLCDFMESPGSKELLLKPNNKKFTHLLKFKVNNMVKYAMENNLAISDYAETSLTSSNHNVRRNLVTINEDALRVFCWGIIKSYLSNFSSSLLIPPDVSASLAKPIKVERKPEQVVTTTTSTKKQKSKLTSAGTPSISSFFKKKG